MIDPWKLLDLPHDATVRDVKRRYAQLLKLNRPDDDPSRFARLRWAYEACLARVGDERVTVEIETGSATPTEPAIRPDEGDEAAPIKAPPLRPLREVVDELCARADPGMESGLFTAWFARCPELLNFAAHDAIERELLGRLASGSVDLSDEAFSILSQNFGWGQIGFARRLHASGMTPERIRQVTDALESRFIDLQFTHYLAARDTFYRHTLNEWHEVLGHPDGERAELRRLRDERDLPWSRWLRAVHPDAVNVANRLFSAYAAHYGANAVDRLFGADAVAFWSRAHPGGPPAREQFVLATIRWLLCFSALGALVTLIRYSIGDPQLGHILRNLWIAVFGCTALAVGIACGPRWMRLVVAPRFRGWCERFMARHERYLKPAFMLLFALVATVLMATAILSAIASRN